LIGPAGAVHLFAFGILIPISAIRSKKLLETRPLPARRRYFRAVVIQVAMLTLISIAVAWPERIRLFPPTRPPLQAVLAGALMLVIAVAFGWTRWKKAVAERKRVVALFMPLNASERAFWVASAMLAGFGEEVTWRGVQTALLVRLTGNLVIAAAICVAMFAIAHAIQGWKSVGIIAVFAAAFHALVWLAGSLYVAMAVHFVYDLIAGFAYAYLGKKMGYVVGEGIGPVPEPATDAV
jgi:membrane protease YdiL (CAAX protease family)